MDEEPPGRGINQTVMIQKRIIIHSRVLDDLVRYSLIHTYEVRLIGLIDRKDGLLAEVEIRFYELFDIDKLIDNLSDCISESPFVEKRYTIDKRVAGRVIDRVSVEGLPFEVNVSATNTVFFQGEERKVVEMRIGSRFPHLADLIVYEEDESVRK